MLAARPRSAFFSKAWLLAAGAMVGVPCFSCGPVGQINSVAPAPAPAPSGSNAQAVSSSADTQTPGAAFDDAVAGHALALVGAAATSAFNPPGATLWLNFAGAAVTQGYGPRQSFLLCAATAAIPPASELSVSDQASVVTSVQQFFAAAGVALNVTATEPANGDFRTIHIGGSGTDLGCAEADGVGLAPLDSGALNPNDVAFLFNEDGATAASVAINAAHLAGHLFGLQHVSSPSDLMSSPPSGAATSFGSASLVTDGTTQNETALLQAALATPTAGATKAPGWTTINLVAQGISTANTSDVSMDQILPALQATVPSVTGNMNFPQVASAIAAIAATPTLASLAKAEEHLAANQTWVARSLPPLPPLPGLPPLPPFGPSPSATAPVGSTPPAAAPAPATPAAPAPATTAPDFASLLGLPTACPNMTAWTSSLFATTTLVVAGYSGNQELALLSMLQSAYAQQYAKIRPAQ